MAKFAVMASELKSLKKSMEDKKLAELKKEIIEILKKQDEKDFKKAIDYFESQELHFTHLEKSLVSGKWIEKAGYGIGTVRIWKGKKYKKIAPGKWARVFEKEGRGTNIAIGKLIAKVQKIDNVEDLMAFVMANKQRFVDENGVDLPVLDKLRAAVDARNGNVESKGTSKPAENKELSMKEKVLIATDEGAKKELGRGKMYKKHVTEIQKYANSNINDIPENLKTITDFIKYQDSMSSPDYKQAGRDYARLHNHNLAREIWQNVADGKAEWDDNGYLKLDKNGLLARPEKKEEPADNRESRMNGLKEEVDPRTGKENYWIIDSRGNRLTNKDAIKRIQGNLAKIDELENSDEPRKDMKIKDLKFDNEYLRDRLNSDDRKESETEKETKEPIMNHPEALKGIDFVNKNKMHVLANFLANHDKVNMATAVVRLQNAYERLGEEKFLSYFPKDVVERYRKESGKEETKTETPKFTPKKDFKSMSDDELKDYEAKLEKDLLNSNRNDSDYMDKYNHWREVHGENNDRFHQAIEDEARAEKQAEVDAKSAKEKEINEKYNGYFENRKGLDKARDLKTLEKKYNFDGKVMSSKEFVEQAIDNGAEIKEREVNKLDYPSRTRWNRMNGYEQEQYEKRIKEAGKKTVYSINGFEFPKTVVDYAKYYKEKGKSESGSEKPSKSEIAIKNKATSLAGAFGYSKTYATKMGSPFNLELAEQTVDEELDWDDGSKKALKEELRRIYSEKKVQKSLFDDFIMDVFEADDEEEIEDAIKADETEYNDYSAEQPELFNSTAMKVREALDRIRNQVL